MRVFSHYMRCCNLSLGLATKAKGLQTKRKLENEGKCEGMNPHIPKGASTLGVWNLSELPNLQRAITGVKNHWIEEFFISLKSY